MKGFLWLLVIGGVLAALFTNGRISLEALPAAPSLNGLMGRSEAPRETRPATPPAASRQTYFQYIDASGSVRFATRLEDVPAEWRSRVGRIEMAGPPPSSPAAARAIREERTRHVVLARSRPGLAVAAQPNVVLYTTTTCGVCKRALAYLDRRGVRYLNKDINADPEAREEFRKKGGRGVPLIEVDGEIMRGFNQQRLDELLS